MTGTELHRVADAEELARSTADRVLSDLGAALARRGRARCVLAGGATPLGLYRLLASRLDAVDWSRVEFFWGDERCVPPEDDESNYGAARATLLDPLDIDPARCARIQGELPPEQAAAEYDTVVEAALADGAWDLVLLGLGSDGHTASLFPPRRPEPESSAWAVAVEPPGTACPALPRVSLTLRALNRSRQVVFLAAGSGKARAVARVMACDKTLHASAVTPPDGRVTWYVDRAAAAYVPATVQSTQE